MEPAAGPSADRADPALGVDAALCIFSFVRSSSFVVAVLISAAVLAIRLSNGPIYFDALRDRVALSLQDRLTGRLPS